MTMMDPNFDPLLELETHSEMLNELVHHHNSLEAIMVQLTQQHKELVDMIRKDRSLIVRHEQKFGLLEKIVEDLYVETK